MVDYVGGRAIKGAKFRLRNLDGQVTKCTFAVAGGSGCWGVSSDIQKLTS